MGPKGEERSLSMDDFHIAGRLGADFRSGHISSHCIPFDNGIRDGRSEESDGFDGIVITWDHVVDTRRVAIGVAEGHHWNPKFLGFFDCVVLPTGVYDKENAGLAFHRLDSTQGPFHFGHLAGVVQAFFFGAGFKPTIFPFSLHANEAVNGFPNGTVVCEGSTEPAVVYEILAAALTLFSDDVCGRALGPNKEDLLALGNLGGNETGGFNEAPSRLVEIDDVNTILITVNVRTHLRIPQTCPVAEMNT